MNEIKSIYAVRCGVCGGFTEAKGPKPVKRPRCWKHRLWDRQVRVREEEDE